MGLMAKAKTGSNFEPVSEGLHQAICSAVVDLGVQAGSELYPKPKRQVYLRFDCVDEPIEYEKDGQWITGAARCGATYTLSLSDKAKLRTLLESWRGRKFSDAELEGFDLSKLLNAPCQVQILHNHKAGNVYANVQTIVPWPKNVTKPQAPEDAVYYSATDPTTFKDFENLPQWLQERVTKRLADTEEDMGQASPPATSQKAETDFDDDIPFAFAFLAPLAALVCAIFGSSSSLIG